jgi:hypothetical protein
MVQRYAHLSPGHQRQAIERLVTRAVSVPRSAEATGQHEKQGRYFRDAGDYVRIPFHSPRLTSVTLQGNINRAEDPAWRVHLHCLEERSLAAACPRIPER